MPRLSFLVFIAFFGLAFCRPEEKYTTKYDGVDLDAVIRNDRLLKNYVECMLGKRKCTADGAELKKHIPEALKEDCLKCSDVQRKGSRKILTHLIKNRRDWFNELEAKYDSEHIYRKQYDEEFKKAGVVL